ncbi:MAG: thiamine-phosphate pyrophosphorylase [Candidatus Hydrogenedentota bacterium]
MRIKKGGIEVWCRKETRSTMQKTGLNKIYRIIDANYNRTTEGLRVLEDISRFILDDKRLQQQIKKIRHTIKNIIAGQFGNRILIQNRNSQKDVGRCFTIKDEKKRKNFSDIIYANAKRITESLRVIEEIMKLITKKNNIKKLRYQVYSIEKKIISKL